MATDTAQRKTLDKLADHWAKADIEGILSCFTPNAEYAASLGPLPGEHAKGHRAIRTLLAQMLAHDDIEKAEVSDLRIHNDHGSWLWRYTDKNGAITLGCDLFRFQGQLILRKDAYRKVMQS